MGTPQRLTDGQGQVVWLAESKAFGSTDIKLG
ncbi:MAG: RHS domain-containing protein, partial [Candidatus Methylumidiphilus sp.]